MQLKYDMSIDKLLVLENCNFMSLKVLNFVLSVCYEPWLVSCDKILWP